MAFLSPQTYVIDDEVHQRRYMVSPRLEFAPDEELESDSGRWQVTDIEVLGAEEFNTRGEVICTWAHGAADRFADRAWRLLLRQPLLRESMAASPKAVESVPANVPLAPATSAASTLSRLRQFRQEAEAEKNRHDRQADRKSG